LVFQVPDFSRTDFVQCNIRFHKNQSVKVQLRNSCFVKFDFMRSAVHKNRIFPKKSGFSTHRFKADRVLPIEFRLSADSCAAVKKILSAP